MTSGEKAEILKTNLMAIHNTGIIVTSIKFDGLLSNISMCKILGVNMSVMQSTEHYFPHPVIKNKIFVICNGCHVLKLLRNSFGSETMYDGEGNLISWTYIEELVDFQNTNGLLAGNKLR